MGSRFAVCGFRLAVCGLPSSVGEATFLVSHRLILVYWRNSIGYTARKPRSRDAIVNCKPQTANCKL
jgi:hypothetical protein